MMPTTTPGKHHDGPVAVHPRTDHAWLPGPVRAGDCARHDDELSLVRVGAKDGGGREGGGPEGVRGVRGVMSVRTAPQQ